MDAVQIMWERVRGLGESALTMLPGLVVGALALLGFVLLARVVRRAAHRVAERRGHNAGVGLVLGKVLQGTILIIGTLVTATVVFPSFQISNLVEVLGLTSVALGFAFRDILQNFLAGILILLTRPFGLGDQIVYKDFEGTVVDIQTRATFIETYDGRRIVIPNAELFTNAVTVNTANDSRRLEHDIGIGVGDDIEHARTVALDTLREAEGVLATPAPEALVVDLGDFAVKLRVRWWISPPRRADVVQARDAVLTRLKSALLAAGIDLPYPTSQVLFHDQTEDTDGDRARQREGWPAGPRNGGSHPTPASEASPQ